MAGKGSWSKERLLSAARRVVDSFSSTSVNVHASSAAYFFFMSLIPVIIIVSCVISHLGFSESDMITFASQLLPEATGDIAETVIHEAYDNSGLALTLSVFGLLWTASRGSVSLSVGLNSVYGVEEERSWLQRTVISLLSVVVLIALFVVEIYLIFRGAVVRALSPLIPHLVQPDVATVVLHSVLVFAAAIVIFALCYTHLPSGKRGFKSQLPGAVLTAVAMLVFSFGFRIYMSFSDRYTVIYGSLATVAIFLFWLYCVLLILLVGAFFNRCLQEYAEYRK